MPFAYETAHHRFIATISISLVARVAVGLECLVAAPCGFATPGIQIYGARNCPITVGQPLALCYRILMHPIHPAALHGQQLRTQVYISALPNAIPHLRYDLPSQ